MADLFMFPSIDLYFYVNYSSDNVRLGFKTHFLSPLVRPFCKKEYTKKEDVRRETVAQDLAGKSRRLWIGDGMPAAFLQDTSHHHIPQSQARHFCRLTLFRWSGRPSFLAFFFSAGKKGQMSAAILILPREDRRAFLVN